ncbi:type II toxin-antitoxin system YafQ family toxin [Xenorhabdus koppenhoeferi]|uniref:type II toxin-antitoxin system YafQ family toxin n=1 Tax=Xenorhabdus koppenhoeferi TaxID=351659 RepID=UPI0038CD79CB
MMRKISRSSEFKKDYKRVKKGRYCATIDESLVEILDILVNDKPIPTRYVDHPLKGDWRGFRDSHLHPDLLLIYKKVGNTILELARLGSHSELF